MNSIKKWSKIGLLFLILIVIGVAPIFISNVENKRLINQVHKVKLRDGQYVIQNELGVVDKIKTIINAREKQSMSIFRQELLKIENKQQILEEMVEQFKQLQAMNILPSMDLNQGYISRDVSKIAYLDNNNSISAVDLWEVMLSFSEFDIWASVDAETFLIYEFVIMFKDREKNNEEILPDNYFHYLGIDQENIIYKVSNFSEYYIYKDKETQFSYKYERYDYGISFILRS